MSKQTIAVAIYNLKKSHQFFITIDGVLTGADELLTKYYGRKFEYQEANDFVAA